MGPEAIASLQGGALDGSESRVGFCRSGASVGPVDTYCLDTKAKHVYGSQGRRAGGTHSGGSSSGS